MVIAITRSGYIKRLPVTTYREQRRGGIGVMGMDLKDEDYIEHLFVASTHDYLLFFTTVGKVYRLKVHELPLGTRQSKGRAIVNLLPFAPGRAGAGRDRDARLQGGGVPRPRDAQGDVKKTRFEEYNTPLKADGIIAIKLRDERRARRRAPLVGRRRHHPRLPQGPGDPLQREERAADGPRHLRREGHGAAQGATR